MPALSWVPPIQGYESPTSLPVWVDGKEYVAYGINTKEPPFNDVRVRYELNMATDKQALVDFLGAGQIPALNVVPPMEGYPSPKTLEVTVDRETYDVLAYNP